MKPKNKERRCKKIATPWKFLLSGLICLLIFAYIQGERNLPLAAYEGKSIEEILRIMPNKDKKRLEYFFRNAIDWDAMGYVLFGNKPMAYLEGFQKKLSPFKSIPSFCYALSPRRIQAENGFKTWKKYETLFPMTRFIFLYEETDSDVMGLFINKDAFNQKVRECADDFKIILQKDVSGEQLLAEAHQTPLLSRVLQNHDVLMGILFGFGRENAYAFYQRSLLRSREQKREFRETFRFGDPWKKEFEELNKKWDSINWVSRYITGDHLKNLELITYPGFLALLESDETQQLKEDYVNTRKKIIDYYQDKDFLESTLRMLTSE